MNLYLKHARLKDVLDVDGPANPWRWFAWECTPGGNEYLGDFPTQKAAEQFGRELEQRRTGRVRCRSCGQLSDRAEALCARCKYGVR